MSDFKVPHCDMKFGSYWTIAEGAISLRIDLFTITLRESSVAAIQ